MDVITTHTNADFDALASMVAAKKLYPSAAVLLPSSLGRKVREFVTVLGDILTIGQEDDFKINSPQRLIVVDTRIASRLGSLSGLVAEAREVHVYDHHPRAQSDIKAKKDVYENVGATVTIFVELIRKRGLYPTPVEATLMLLGLYEETGSLSFLTTTRRDIDAAGFLLDCGADLSLINSYLQVSLLESEHELLIKLLKCMEIVELGLLRVAICRAESSGYQGDLGLLAHKLQDIEALDCLFLIVRLGNYVKLICRSRSPLVDTNKIARAFGGGGHISAASAKVKGVSLDRIRRRLLEMLESQVPPGQLAEDLMLESSRCCVSANVTIAQAWKILSELKLGAIAVVERGRLIGLLTRRNVTRALQNSLSHIRVKGFITKRFCRVWAQTPVAEMVRRIPDCKSGAFVVLNKKNKIIGLVRCTDLLRFLRKYSAGYSPNNNLKKIIRSRLPKKIQDILKTVGCLADQLQYNAFMVGGIVRDLLLGIENLDVDIVLEGDAIRLARILANKLNGNLVVYDKFGTATVMFADGLRLDFARARSEYYSRPGSLPQVTYSSIKEDLRRRDFTINAMAVKLNAGWFPELLDFFGGLQDLRKGKIRILHERSFIDDPTRIFRAVRFEQRFGFHIERHTEYLIKEAVNLEMFRKVSGERLRNEIILNLSERAPVKIIRRMNELHQLRFIHPRIRLNAGLLHLLKSTGGALNWYRRKFTNAWGPQRWLIFFMALIKQLSLDETELLCRRLALSRRDTKKVISCKSSMGRVLGGLSKKVIRPSQIYRLLEGLSQEEVIFIYALARSRRQKQRIFNYLKKLRTIRLKMGGDDLKKLGVAAGPGFRQILDKVLNKKIDGKLRTKKEELDYARRISPRQNQN
jgi:tRNA nucleotidyltransferase (CCA-adding enzyme)